MKAATDSALGQADRRPGRRHPAESRPSRRDGRPAGPPVLTARRRPPPSPSPDTYLMTSADAAAAARRQMHSAW